MTGKIFAESENIYQDQAKILFNYYKTAAEKIVTEEMGLESKIDETRNEINRIKDSKTPSIVGLVIFILVAIGGIILAATTSVGGGVFLMILGVVFIIVFAVKLSGLGKKVEAAEQKILAYEQAKADIRRDYKVSKIGVAYVPVEMNVPFGNGHISVDLTEGTEQTKFSLSTIRKPEEWNETLNSVAEEIKKIPVVEGSDETEQIDTADYSTSMQNVTMHDYMSSIDRQVRNIRYLLGDSERKSVSLPLVKPNSKEDNFLKNFATSEAPAGHPVVNVFDEKKFDTSLKVFNDINIMKKNMEQSDASSGASHVDYYKALMKTLGESIQVISASKASSCDKLIDYCNGIFANVLKAAYNQYSPVLEAEEIERIRNVAFDFKEDSTSYKPFNLQASSRVKYDLFQSVWLAEDGSRTSMPFSMNQIQEEVFAPLIENLMEENRKDRLDVYNDIENQKTDYLMQWHRDADDFNARNRAAAQDLIRDFMSANSEFMTALNTYKALQQSLDDMKQSGSLAAGEVQVKDKKAEALAAMEVQAAACRRQQEEFSEYMDRVAEDIQQKSERFKYVEYFEATLRDAEAKDIAVSSDSVQELDDRRRSLLAINAYTAANAELPPEPQVSEDMMEDFSLNLIKEVDSILEKYENMGVEEKEVQPLPAEEDAPIAEDVAAADTAVDTAASAAEENVEAAAEEESGDASGAEAGAFVFCTECGAKIPAGSKFCEECGAQIDNEEA